MFFSTLEIAEPGFLFVNLSYENESDNWVYFDDLKITHTPTNIVQYNDYYPYGLQTSTSWTREDSHNNHLYNQGNELNPSTGWYETFFRNYDPALGRFTAIDPLATKFASLSGYHYAYNNPVMFNDPLGAQGEPGNPWFSGGYRWMENMSPPPAAYNSMGASTFGSTMGNYWYQAMSGNNWGEQMMHQSQLASQARGGDMGAVREYAARYGGGGMPVEVWHSTAQAGGETYYHYEIVVGGGQAQNEGNPITPWEVGMEWLTGTGPRHRDFTNGDYFTEMLRQHSHVAATRGIIIDRIANGGKLKDVNPYSLSGVQGVGKYLKDYSTLTTGGLTGNIAVTYLGSYRLNWEVTGINGNTATVLFIVNHCCPINKKPT